MANVKLHEVIAVIGKLKGQADKTRTDLSATFEKKRHLFMEKTVTFKSNEEHGVDAREEQLDLQTTVQRELAWIGTILIPAIDTAYAIDEANTQARADLELEDGTILMRNMPATALLQLEKRVAELQTLVASVPTLDPAKGFSLDPAKGPGIYKARETLSTRTRKTQQVLTLAPATDKHPAQVQLVPADVPVGTVQTLEWSGLITPADKASMLERVESLSRAVKKARSRANQADVPHAEIGAKLLAFVFGTTSS